jgi:uncharacterized protein YoxC
LSPIPETLEVLPPDVQLGVIKHTLDRINRVLDNPLVKVYYVHSAWTSVTDVPSHVYDMVNAVAQRDTVTFGQTAIALGLAAWNVHTVYTMARASYEKWFTKI